MGLDTKKEMDNKSTPNREAAGLTIASTEGKLIVLTAPLTEIIDHAGFFIQMAMASMPAWMERVLNKRYPGWRELKRNGDGSALSMPAGIRILEESLLRGFSPEEIIACY